MMLPKIRRLEAPHFCGASLVGPTVSDAVFGGDGFDNTRTVELKPQNRITRRKKRGLKMGRVAQVMPAYPSLAMGNQQVAWDDYLDGLTQGFAGRVLRWLSP